MRARRARRHKAVIIALAIVAAIAAVPLNAGVASALSGSDFDPGNIISDERFFDNASMTEAQIQQFLDAQVPNCRATDPTLPCLRYLVTSTTPRAAAANGCAAYASEGWESAARILWKVAQACRINPQVLIVTLQKEQSLITATAPTARQYRAAMGADCPDTAACSPDTPGFFNQVYKAAWQLRQYTYNPTRWRHQVGATDILYSPRSICGSSTVIIRNQATANLYNYTPYQPNAAALRNLYGEGDYCSTYGNRNFWRMFTGWFGSTTARGTSAIDAVYYGNGGTTGPLGAATSDYLSISSQTGSGTARAYQGGSIYWTPRTGAAAVVEPFRSFYFGYQGATGLLGWPNSPSMSIGNRPGSAGQSFTNGSVYTSTATGTHSVIGITRDHYFGHGGALGWLGWPTAESRVATSNSGPAPAKTGTLQQFEGGTIAWSALTGAHSIPAAISARYSQWGGPDSAVGWPISGSFSYRSNGGGVAQVFEGASVYSSSAGTFSLRGAHRDIYFGVRGAEGWLGWPTTDVICLEGGRCWQHFQNASILSDASGARVALAAIEDHHVGQGGDQGRLGKRTSGLIPISSSGGGLGQAYAGGSVYFSKAGTYDVSGSIRDYYFARSGADGALGFPTSSQTCEQGSCWQSFAGGTVVSAESTGTYVSTAPIHLAHKAAGGNSGALGAVQSSVITIPENGSGVAQVFRGGSVYSSGAGTFAVSEPIRGLYFARGGSAGDLGWPASGMVCDSDGACTQQFQRGTISWSPEGGAAYQ
ncbi:hypothetical protein AB2L57_13450 [Microbacterium sp. HA-8]|uniref:hypothetical protein n=1 Tax=Microbacterium sp. HA-8 TaxID=3234200 RepID=UPI0038F7B044